MSNKDQTTLGTTHSADTSAWIKQVCELDGLIRRHLASIGDEMQGAAAVHDHGVELCENCRETSEPRVSPSADGTERWCGCMLDTLLDMAERHRGATFRLIECPHGRLFLMLGMQLGLRLRQRLNRAPTESEIANVATTIGRWLRICIANGALPGDFRGNTCQP